MAEMTEAERFLIWDGTFRRMNVYPLFDSSLGVLILVPDQGDLRQRADTVAELGRRITKHATESLYPAAQEAMESLGGVPAQAQGSGGAGNGRARSQATALDPAQLAAAIAAALAPAMAAMVPQPEVQYEDPPRSTDVAPAQRRRRARSTAEGEGRDLGRAVKPRDPRALSGTTKQGSVG